MKILLINPNSSEAMTADIRKSAAYAESESVSIDVVRMPNSPHVLESFADYTEAGKEVVKYLRELNRDGAFPYDGVVLACMGDPCLFGVKEACPVPLVGIAESAISLALLTGYKFTIVAASSKAKPMMDSMVLQYGMTARMASVEALDQPIDAFMADPDILREGIRKISKTAKEKGAEVLLLGCAGMTMLTEEMDHLSDLPVIDPVIAGIEEIQAILRGGFKISRAGLYQ